MNLHFLSDSRGSEVGFSSSSLESDLDPPIPVQICLEIFYICQKLCDGALLFNLDSLLMNLEDLSSSFLDFLQSKESQVGIFHLELSFLKLVLLPEMELILSAIRKEGREVEALVFLIHFNRMLEDKVSNNTTLVLSELFEMIKLTKIEVVLMVQLNYEAHLIRILGLHEGLHCLRKFPCTVVEKVNGCLSGSLIEKIKGVKVEEARTWLLHVVSSSVSNWPKMDKLGFIHLLWGNLRMLLNCWADLFACVKCQIEVLLRHLNPEANAISDVAMGLNNQLEIIINQFSRRSLQLDIVSIVGMPGLGKTTLVNEHCHNFSAKY